MTRACEGGAGAVSREVPEPASERGGEEAGRARHLGRCSSALETGASETTGVNYEPQRSLDPAPPGRAVTSG